MIRPWLIVVVVLTSLPNALFGQRQAPQNEAPMMGFGDSASAIERMAEAKLIGMIQPATLDTVVHDLSSELRIAGSPADEASRDYVVKRLRTAGLDVKVYPYRVYLPYATATSLEMVSPKKKVFSLVESELPAERGEHGTAYPWANGYTGEGNVTAEVVYVNYGLHDDYRVLDSLGISVKGKILLARYGRSYRGIKAQLAEEHGAAGLLLYSDPTNDGFAQGDVYPHGPMRPMDGIQRGSIYNGHGDPTTPSYASTADAKRTPLASATGLVQIPVMPISAEIAQELLSEIASSNGVRTQLPDQSWQGALPFRYHVANTAVSVHLSIKTDGQYRTIWNTVATVEGSELPGEWVIVGGHRDAWGPGAEDNGSGAAAVVAAAEATSALAKQGIRPRRSILFATWDAEEWGLIGSTEWVEDHERSLLAQAVVYLNEDECATGDVFSAGADPLLRAFMTECTRAVPSPKQGTIYDAWMESMRPVTVMRALHGSVSGPEVGLLGGGSDFTSFCGHLGLPAIEQSFNGPFGQYHSMHDSYNYVRHFGDSSFVYHAAIAKLVAVEALRMANARILGYDFAELARRLSEFTHHLSQDVPAAWNEVSPEIRLDSALKAMHNAAELLNTWREERVGAMTTEQSERVNARLHKLLYAFVAPSGIHSDPWIRNTLVATDPDNGYAELTLPEMHIAIRSHDKQQFDRSMLEFERRIGYVTRELLDVTRFIREGE